MSLTPEEKLLVSSTYQQIVLDSEHVAEKFYSRLFDLYPETQLLFQNTDMARQHKMFIDMISLVVYSLDNMNSFALPLHKLGERHKRYGVQKEDYAKMREAFLWMLEGELGSDYTPDVASAWAKVYQLMEDTATKGIYE